MRWNPADNRELIRLAKEGKLFYSEIAKHLGKKEQVVRHHARLLGLPSRPAKERYGTWNIKHAHLSEKVLTYFLTHTFEETRLKFKFTNLELKSLFTAAYKNPKFRHIRKDKRNRNPWSTEEYLFAVRRAGVLPRSKIAKRMKRGSAVCIKEKFQSFNASTKYLNGMPWAWCKEIWGESIPDLSLKTKAGPHSTGVDCCFKIVPWPTALEIARTRKTDPKVIRIIRTMAKFQIWIHGSRSKAGITRKIRGILNEK